MGRCAICGAPHERIVEADLSNVPTRMATKRAPVDGEALASYLKEHRDRLGLTKPQVDEALGTKTLYSWFEGRPAGLEIPTPEQYRKLKTVLRLGDEFDDQIFATVEVEVTDSTPNREPGVRTYGKAWNSDRKTTDWRASCDHVGDPVPCDVLDPFAGAGTVAIVAERLGRAAVLVELSPPYSDIAIRRWENLVGEKAEKVDVQEVVGIR